MSNPLQASGLRDFLEPMLNFVPGRRATAAQMLQHPWLRGELPKCDSKHAAKWRGGEGDERRTHPHPRSRTPKRSRLVLL